MPVMGPDKNFADKQGDAATDGILTFLAGNFGVERPADFMFSKKFAKDWDEQVEKLRAIIKEMVWIDHCTSF